MPDYGRDIDIGKPQLVDEAQILRAIEAMSEDDIERTYEPEEGESSTQA